MKREIKVLFAKTDSDGIEMVPVPSYEGEENPGTMCLDTTYKLIRYDDVAEDGEPKKNEASLLTYAFGLLGSPLPEIRVNRPMAEHMARCGSQTARAALAVADRIKSAPSPS